MAPETLGCEDSAEDAKKELTSLLNETSPEKCTMILKDILSLA